MTVCFTTENENVAVKTNSTLIYLKQYYYPAMKKRGHL